MRIVDRYHGAKEVDLLSKLARKIKKLSPLDKKLLEKFIDRKLALLNSGKEDGILPLSHRQQTIWSMCCNMPNSTRYHLPVLFRFSSDIDVAELINAIKQSVQQFPLLDAGVSHCGKLVLNSPSCQSIDKIKLSDAKTQEQELKELQEYIYTPFLFNSKPLFRVAIAQSTSSNYLVMSVHHIIADAKSISLLMTRITELYHQPDNEIYNSCDAELDRLNILASSLAWDDVNQQNLKRKTVELLPRLGTQALGIDLPFDSKSSAAALARAGNCFFSLPADQYTQLTDYAKSQKTTLNMVVLCAFKWLLTLYSGDHKNLIGIPYHNRNLSSFQHSFGFFVNTQAHIFEVDRAQTFNVFLAQSTSAFFSDLVYAEVPLDMLKQKLVQERQCRPQDNINTLYNFYDFQKIEISDGNFEPVWVAAKEPKFALSLHVCNHSKLDMVFEYCADSFSTTIIENIKEKFISILDAVTQDGTTRLSDLQYTASENLLLAWD